MIGLRLFAQLSPSWHCLSSCDARAMFEKHTTKYLKNRCYNYTHAIRAGANKPEDVSLEHWANLVSASKIPRKAEQSGYMVALRQKASNSQGTVSVKRLVPMILHVIVVLHIMFIQWHTFLTPNSLKVPTGVDS